MDSQLCQSYLLNKSVAACIDMYYSETENKEVWVFLKVKVVAH